jgi:hypothetical protein
MFEYLSHRLFPHRQVDFARPLSPVFLPLPTDELRYGLLIRSARNHVSCDIKLSDPLNMVGLVMVVKTGRTGRA